MSTLLTFLSLSVSVYYADLGAQCCLEANKEGSGV